MTSFEPIVPNLLSTQGAMANKYAVDSPYANPTPLLTQLNALPIPPHLYRPATSANTITPLLRYDLARANRGLMPLTQAQSAKALQTLATGQPATKPRRQSLLRAALSDLSQLVGTIPKLPMLAVNELQQLPTVPQQLPEALDTRNPITALGNVATLPGFRLVPGSFIAQQFGEEGQGVGGLLAHPLFTALDVLPAASGAAASTRVVKAARSAAEVENLARVQQAVALTGEGGTANLLPRPRPLPTLATRALDESGAVVPNRLGRATAAMSDAFTSTPTGRALQATFTERATSRLESRFSSFLRRYQDLDTPRALLPTRLNNLDIEPLLDLRDRQIVIRDMARDAGITDARSSELYAIADNPTLPDGTVVRAEEYPGLSTDERAVLGEIRDFQAERARLTEGTLTGRVNIDGTPEVFDLPTARRLSRIQNTVAIAEEMYAARQMVLDPSTVTPERINGLLEDVARRQREGTITRATADDLTRTYEAALDEAGWKPGVNEQGQAILTRVDRPNAEAIVTALRPLARRYPTIPRLIDHLQSGRWSSARADLAQFAETRAGGTLVDTLPFDIDGLKAELSRLQARDRALARTASYTDRRLARLRTQAEKSMSRAVPARFSSAVQRVADEAIEARVGELYATSPDLERMIEMARNRVYDPIHELAEADVRAIQREARESWRAMRDAGLDPIFFSRVTPAQRARLPFARVSDAPVTPAAARARMWDATPYVQDMGVALSRDAMDLMQMRATEAFLDEFETSYGRTRESLATEMYDRATARAARTPTISVQSHLNDLINERWQPWDRSKFSPRKTTGAFSISSREQIMVPRVMAENIERLYAPPLPKLTAALDPIMRVFRTSVLPLAPRWHIYNAIGGATMVAIHDPMAFRYLPEVIQTLWANRESAGGLGAKRVAHQLQPEGAPPSGFGTMPAEVRSWDAEVRANSPLRDRLAATHNYAAGQTLRRWFDTARESRLSKIPDGFRRTIEASYNANQLVDDMYRSAVGISERNRALRQGVSREVADARAVQSIRQVFQAWDAMTPMERSIMRTVVPFYGWSSHILKYAMRYPFDHPVRVAVVGGFARAELADASQGLPQYIRDMILMGDTRANGVVRALNVGPFNPFRDLPSYFTVSGFLGQLNPILTGVLESVGVNVQQGGPSLYPEVRYDPETGRLVADPGGNLASNILGNISPQTNLFMSLAGVNDSFNDLLKRDPDAAGRQLLSNLGVPVLFRDINVGEELIRSELARYEDQENARREALKSGDLSILGDFPGLAAYGDQVRALQESGALDQLRPEAPADLSPEELAERGLPSGAGKAYALQVAALG